MSSQDRTGGVEILDHLLGDPEVDAILVDGPERVYVDKGGRFVDVPSPFRDDEHLMDVIGAILSVAGRRADEASPVVDARLVDGTRVNVVIPPISLIGPVLVLRKFWKTPLTDEDLLRFGASSVEILEFLKACVHARINIVVSGGTGSGKTTLLNIIANFIPSDERIVTVENASELQLLPQRYKHLVRMESRPADAAGQGEIAMVDLIHNALRMRPDRIIAGEVRGGEVLDLLRAMNTGHDGCMMTIHANNPRDVLSRLETMVAMSNPAMPLLNVRQEMTAAIGLIVHIERLVDGSRKVVKVTEIDGLQGDVIALQDIFEFRQTGLKDGRIEGQFTVTGRIPRFMDRIRMAGIHLPVDMFMPI